MSRPVNTLRLADKLIGCVGFESVEAGVHRVTRLSQGRLIPWTRVKPSNSQPGWLLSCGSFMSNRYFKEGSLSFTAKERREIDQI